MVTDHDLLDQLRREHDDVFGARHCPPLMLEALERYVAHGIRPGDCLRAILANDLMAAFQRADVETARRMAAIVSYVYNCVPHGAHGSYEAVDNWINGHRVQRAQKREDGEP